MVPFSAGLACASSLGNNKFLHKILIKNFNICTKQYEKDRQFFMPFDKLLGESLRHILIDRIELVSLCDFFNDDVVEIKEDSSEKQNIKMNNQKNFS